jgi:hypothetical protein
MGAPWITRERLVVWSSSRWVKRGGFRVQVGFADELFDALEISVDGDQVLIACDVSAFHSDWRGPEEV